MRAGDQRAAGYATVWAATAIAALLAIAALVICGGAAAVARHRANGAADLAALAAAGRVADGEQAACARAGLVADRMGTRLVSCRLAGRDALVEVGCAPPRPLDRFGTASARARAGPVAKAGRAVAGR
ncbi:Rv3654c family TadE-like protein [Amycolatopsis minnesotensis]|uniref:Putative Flp pilus-assembly TadG-like N-terminal domain-containing protein n=1 Tax=Amycolatopsis minnesotensis TaxID=337894 RepID=A0ABN2Q2H4_9PSEU